MKQCTEKARRIARSLAVRGAYEELEQSFERFCIQTGLEALQALMEEDVRQLCGPRHGRSAGAFRWGSASGEVVLRGGKVPLTRPRVRQRDGREVTLPSYQVARDHDLLERWAFNQMILGVSTRRFSQSLRLPDDPAPADDGTSRSAVSRRFVAISQDKLADWLSKDLSGLDILVIQIDGLRVADQVMVAALGIDADGVKHPLSLMMGATENHVVVQALLDDLSERGLTPDRARLFLVDGSRALRKAVRNSYGDLALIQRCQVHKARNILERLPKGMQASVRKALRQAWEAPSADVAEKLLRNLARRLEPINPQAAASVLEGLDEIICVVRLGLPPELRKVLATTNAIESMNSSIRRVTRNVKRWRNGRMVLRWTATGILEAGKSFYRIRARKHLPILKARLEEHARKAMPETGLQIDRKVA